MRLFYDTVEPGDILVQSTYKGWGETKSGFCQRQQEVVRYIVLQKYRCTTSNKDYLKTWILWIDNEQFHLCDAAAVHHISRYDMFDWWFSRLEP